MSSESETWADAIDRLVAEVENGLVLLSASGPDILDGATLEIRRQKARVAQLEQHSAILLQLIDRGFTDAPGMDTATDEMIADGVVPEGWSIYDVRPPPEQGEPRG